MYIDITLTRINPDTSEEEKICNSPEHMVLFLLMHTLMNPSFKAKMELFVVVFLGKVYEIAIMHIYMHCFHPDWQPFI